MRAGKQASKERRKKTSTQERQASMRAGMQARTERRKRTSTQGRQASRQNNPARKCSSKIRSVFDDGKLAEAIRASLAQLARA